VEFRSELIHGRDKLISKIESVTDRVVKIVADFKEVAEKFG
jgi:hypothetical protein